jgi:signal transduction histidine kinase
VFRWFSHIPILLAGFWFGLRGGLLTSLIVTALYIPHVLFQWGGGTVEQWLEIVLYNIVGVVTGILSDGQKRDGDRHKTAAVELDRAYVKLKEQTRVILETEEQLRRADRLSALGQLSAGLAHEVKTPLASIRGAAEILCGSSVNVAEREEFSQILIREADRLNRVVTQFLEFARPRGDAIPEADLTAAIEEILQLVKLEADRRRVAVKKALQCGLPFVRIDPEQIRQVVLNLVINALQAMDSGGTLELRTVKDGDRVHLTVADSGEGIPDDLRVRIFDPFVTSRAEGTGLGLSIVMRILENHGATIEVRSRQEGGTEFEVGLLI